MHAHVRPIVYEVRVYESDIHDGVTGYDRRETDEMVAVCLARVLHDGEMYVSLMHGTWGREQMHCVLEAARQHGVRRLWYERHGKLRSLVVR
jgi:hypothetical protein